jgi:hypothetical protein
VTLVVAGALVTAGSIPAVANTWSQREAVAVDQWSGQRAGGCYTMGFNENESGPGTAVTKWYGGFQRTCIGMSVNYKFTVNGVPIPPQWSSWKYTTSAYDSRVTLTITATNHVFYLSGHRGEY